MATQHIKNDFPIFKKHPDLVYLDSTATSLKPNAVIGKITEYYTEYSANVFRGIYEISEKATKEYEESRDVVASFINARNRNEIIFTRNTSESLNLIAYSLGRKILNEGDEIVTTIMEHHSNFVPWQQLAVENGITFKVIGITNEGELDLKDKLKIAIKNSKLKKLQYILTKKTKILALTYVSNVLGTINPVKEIIAEAKKINPHIVTVVDAAQAVPHMKIDVQDLGCDFLAFSSHKMLGPTGVGVLWGRYELLADMYPFQYGGEMVEEVRVDATTFQKPPHKFEAGTPHIAGVVGLKTAVEYLHKIGFGLIRKHEMELTSLALKFLKEEFGKKINIVGPQEIEKRGGILAFSFGNLHSHDISQVLDEQHIAVRAGHHCAMPLHTTLGLSATTRASFYIYNDKTDVEKLVEGLKKVEHFFT